MTKTTSSNLLALDVGNKRIGVALASSEAKLPNPLTTIENNDQSLEAIKKIIEQENIGVLVVGLPRGLSGQDTEQTNIVLEFGKHLSAHTGLKIYWQDEALTSKQAESELNQRGLSYNKEHVDALAATYILSDFLTERRERQRNEKVS